MVLFNSVKSVIEYVHFKFIKDVILKELRKSSLDYPSIQTQLQADAWINLETNVILYQSIRKYSAMLSYLKVFINKQIMV